MSEPSLIERIPWSTSKTARALARALEVGAKSLFGH